MILTPVTDKEKEETAAIIALDTNDFVEMSGEIKFGERDKIIKMVSNSIDNLALNGNIEFPEEYLIGKLINVLDDDKATERIISDLSQVLTAKSFCTLYGGEELVRIFQSMRPKLMKLYVEKTPNEISGWFEK